MVITNKVRFGFSIFCAVMALVLSPCRSTAANSADILQVGIASNKSSLIGFSIMILIFLAAFQYAKARGREFHDGAMIAYLVSMGHIVFFLISLYNPAFILVNTGFLACCFVGIVVYWILNARVREEMAAALNPFDDVLKTFEDMMKSNDAAGTPIVGDLTEIRNMIVSLSKRTKHNKVERDILAAEMRDKVGKLSYVAGESYYLKIAEDGSGWKDGDAKMVEVENAVKKLRDNISGKLISINKGVSARASERIRSMVSVEC